MSTRILVGDVRERLAELPGESVQCCVTSPPYWGLRDYGVDGQLGLEPTPDEWVANMVDVFREVRRVLRGDGVVWLNIGDSYGPNGSKQLIGQPWRLAFALQADGWWLRADCIWAKPNPMPESVTDRPTKAHEYVFLLSKSARYFYDADAVREPPLTSGLIEGSPGGSQKTRTDRDGASNDLDRSGKYCGIGGRNLRTVWSIPTHPYPEAHFATFPPKLVEPCIKAGTSERGCCPECGAPWERVVEVGELEADRHAKHLRPKAIAIDSRDTRDKGWSHEAGFMPNARRQTTTTGWRPTCTCLPADPVPCTVLDPFLGSGTTALVADRLGRHCIGIELNPKYAELARKRVESDNPMFTQVSVE